jgi:choline dehydrogenase
MDVDFIIVGAGSAGCALADKLSADGRFKVLVLEAGGSDRRFWVQVPLGYGKLFYDQAVNWAYTTAPDPGLGGRADYWPRGKIVGGSSAINAMVYIRGHRGDYDDWAAAGNPGWGWDEVLRVYKAMEASEAGDDAFRGRGGPLHVAEVSRRLHPLCRAYIAAGQQAGLAFNPDFNGPTQDGIGVYEINTWKGRRNSAARAFLYPAMKRGNVETLNRALVTRVLFAGRRATGVEYVRDGETRTAMARREVILSGGAVNTPQILQLSGIGPGALLQALGIAVVASNANVGRHLQDHLGINYTYRSTVASLNTVLRPWWGKLVVGMQYVFWRSGPLSLSLNQGGGFFRTGPERARPNMQLYMQAITTVKPRAGERPLLTPDPYPGFSLGLSSCRPRARGFIEIASADPQAAPCIVANAFGQPDDMAEMLAAVKFLRRLASMPALAAVIAEELLPGPAVASDDELVADIRRRSGTVYHPSCSCRMGPDPASAVVDARLRVHGIEALRVVDASIFPNLISGNTNAPAMMVGIRAGELILEDCAP